MTDYLDAANSFDDPDVVSGIDESSTWASRFGRLLLDELGIVGGIRGLDVGCGAGYPLIELAQMHGATCRFVGVDVWEAAIARAAMKARVHGLRNVRVIVADAASLPLAKASFDLIVSNLGVNNFADPAAVLGECARVARIGARIALTTNPAGHMREFYEMFGETLAALGHSDRFPELSANIEHRGTRETLAMQCEHAGFEVERVIEDQFQLRYLDGSAMLRHSLTRFGFLPGWRKVVGPADERAVFGALERRLNERARRENGLRMTVPMLYIEGRRV